MDDAGFDDIVSRATNETRALPVADEQPAAQQALDPL